MKKKWVSRCIFKKLKNAIRKLKDNAPDEQFKVLFSAAKIFKKVALNANLWTFERNLNDDTHVTYMHVS